jgi:hypothetical protein
MKLFQFICNSNQEIINLKTSFWTETLTFKSAYFMADSDVVDDVMQINMEFLNESTNVHTTLKNDYIVLPLSTEAGKRKHKKHYHITLNDVNIPQSTIISCYAKDGTPFDNTKFGTLVLTFEADSTV